MGNLSINRNEIKKNINSIFSFKNIPELIAAKQNRSPSSYNTVTQNYEITRSYTPKELEERKLPQHFLQCDANKPGVGTPGCNYLPVKSKPISPDDKERLLKMDIIASKKSALSTRAYQLFFELLQSGALDNKARNPIRARIDQLIKDATK